jgi:organic radical activating enzyme
MQPSIKILDVFIGNMCNLSCFQCDTRSDIIKNHEYDSNLDSIKQGIILASNRFKIHEYSLLGGEPLLYKERVTELLKFIRSFDQDTVINLPTNGLLLSKNKKFVVELIKNYKICVMVSDHCFEFKDKTMSNKIIKTVHEIGRMLNYSVQDPLLYLKYIHDFDNQQNDPLFQKWLDKKYPQGIDRTLDREILYSKDKQGIFYTVYDKFLSHYYLDGYKKPKPFDSNNIEESYFNNCCSEMCSYLYDKKIYKCGALGTLERFLKYHNSLNDSAWQKYLTYKPIDLENCTDQEIENFSKTKHSPIKQCAMCPSSNKHTIIKSEEMVLPKFKLNI